MNNKKLNAVQVWKQMEDLLAPQLNFSVNDRAVYSHLLRHSRLVGKLRIRFSLSWLGPRIRLSARTARESVRRLIVWGVLPLVEPSCPAHHVVCLRLPQECQAFALARARGWGSEGLSVRLRALDGWAPGKLTPPVPGQ